MVNRDNVAGHDLTCKVLTVNKYQTHAEMVKVD